MPREASGLFLAGLREPPASLQAEQALLGALLVNNKAAERCAGLRQEHFYDPVNGRIFAAIMRRIEAGRLADMLTLRDDFAASGMLDEVGGVGYLAQLVTAMVGILNAGEYGRMIRACWVRRQIIERCEDAINRAYGQGPDGPDADAQIGLAADAIMALAETEGGGMMSLDEAIRSAVDAMEIARGRQGPAGLSTGFRCLDDRWGGLQPGLLYYIGGRPGMGKSVVVHQMALAAARAGHGVYEQALEMTGQQLGQRTLAAAAGVPGRPIQNGTTTVEQVSRLIAAQRELRGLPLTISDRAAQGLADVHAGARLAKRKHGLALVVVDHLQILASSLADARENETIKVGHNSTGLKQLAKALYVPVVVAVQLNRGPEAREDKRPTLGDLRQSGSIEQDGDVVAFVHREEYYLGRSAPEPKLGETPAKLDQRMQEWREQQDRVAGRGELITAKWRMGETGTDSLWFDGPTTSFSEDPPMPDEMPY